MKKEKILRIASIIFALLMVAVSFYVSSRRLTAADASGYEMITLGSYTFEMSLLALLYIQNRLSNNIITGFGKFFGFVLLVMCLKLATDQITYIIDGNVSLSWLNWIACTVTYLCSVPIMIFFWNYCGHQLKIRSKEFLIINRIIIILGIIVTVLYLINPITHWFFYIDEEGYFVLAPTYWIMIIQNAFCGITCIISVLKSHIDAGKKAMLSIVFIAPIAGVVLAVLSYDLLFLQYLCMTMAIFFCYVSIFIRGEDEFRARIKELSMATAIQRGALREDFGDFGDHKIYAYMKPAREVGGDFYDFFTVDAHTIGVLIADVSGKGIPAAMFMMQGLCAVRELAKLKFPINEVFEKANNLLCAHNENEFFITAWMAYINRQTGKVIYVNAGHNPPILKRADGSAEYVKCRPGMVLAAMEEVPYRINEFEMNPGDTLFMYTDGIPEAQTIEDELYGEERLLALARSAGPDPEELTITILNGVNSFVGQAEQFDDMTIISYEREK